MTEPKIGRYIRATDNELYKITSVYYMTDTIEVTCVESDSRWCGMSWTVRYNSDFIDYVPEEELMLMKLAGKI